MSKWGFEAEGNSFGDILWCSVEVELNMDSKRFAGGAKGVLQNVLSLFVKEKPDFSTSDCAEELNLVLNYLNKSDLSSFVAIESYLKHNIRSESSEDEGVAKEEDPPTPETEEADSNHFRAMRVKSEFGLMTHDLSEEESERVDLQVPEEEYEEESEYIESQSEGDPDYQSEDLLEEDRPETRETQLDDEKEGAVAKKLDQPESVYEGETSQDEGTEFEDQEDDLVTESESEIIDDTEARRLESTSRSWTDKKFTLSQDNFNQNVQVKLDFEVISNPPPHPSALQTSVRKNHFVPFQLIHF